MLPVSGDPDFTLPTVPLFSHAVLVTPRHYKRRAIISSDHAHAGQLVRPAPSRRRMSSFTMARCFGSMARASLNRLCHAKDINRKALVSPRQNLPRQNGHHTFNFAKIFLSKACLLPSLGTRSFIGLCNLSKWSRCYSAACSCSNWAKLQPFGERLTPIDPLSLLLYRVKT